MSAKRFTTNGYYIYDHFKEDKWLVNEVEAEEIVTIMNNLDTKAREKSKALSKLQKENEQLKTDIRLHIDDSEKYRKLSLQFDNRNKELISENALLEKENERLKKELHRVYDDDYYLKQFIMAIVTVFSSGNSGLSKSRYELIVNACEMNKTSLKEFFK